MDDIWAILIRYLLIPLLVSALLWFLIDRRLEVSNAKVTRNDVIRKVLSTWPSQVKTAMEELDRYDGPETERVQWHAINLSRGSLDYLKRWLRNYDYRDIIMAAESGDAEILKRFDESTHWRPDNESEVSFRDVLDTEEWESLAVSFKARERNLPAGD
jgi:hypothetical protein